MKRLTKLSLAAVAIAVTVAAVTVTAWIVATTQGTRWLLTSAGVSFSAQKIEGRIIDHLLLTGVRITQAQQKVEIDRLELRWKPLLLLAGTVAVQELAIDGMRIQDDAPSVPSGKPPVLAWPKMPRAAHLFDSAIARLRLTNFSYRRLQEQPLLITSIVTSITWQDDLISISDLKVISPSGQINGAFSAGFDQPSLTADLIIAMSQPLAEMDQFSLQVRRSKGPEQFVGTINVAGASGTRKLLELGGDVGMARNAINLRRLSLTRVGHKGLITADGSLAFATSESILTLQLKAAGLDLAPELKVPTDLSGTLTFAGTIDSYRGDLTLANQAKGWQAASFAAVYQGTREGVKVSPLTVRVFDGSLAGKVDMNWRDGFALQGEINGRNLNPARIDPAWKGVANFSASGNMAWVGEAPVKGSVSGALLESSLHGQTLTGGLQANFADNNLSLTRLALKGKGFDIHASGELKQRITLAAQISDFSLLVPGSTGTLQADGWVRWRDGALSGAVTGTGSKLSYGGTRIAAANLAGRLDQGPGYPMHVTATLRDVVYGHYHLNTVTVAADGTLARHTVNATLRSADAEARLTLAAGYNNSVWKGEIRRLSGKDYSGPWNLKAPAAFAVSAGKIFLSPLALTAGASEHLEVATDLALNPLSGHIRAKWDSLNLARANRYLKVIQLTGSSRGAFRMGFLPDKRLSLSGSAAVSGTFARQGHSMTLKRSLASFDGNEQGMRVGIELATADGGLLKGTFLSSDPLRLAIPEKGELTAELSGIDLALLNPWLPPETTVAGHISGRAKGIMLPGQRFDLDGNAVLSRGTLHHESPDGELNLAFTAATSTWSWRGETLAGTLALSMADHGQAKANFQLPFPARLPVAVNPKGPLKASLTGRLHERGIFTALFPELVQESFGELELDLAIGGTWELPQVGGKVQLAKAGAFLPSAGIHVANVQLTASLGKNLVRINSFRALSGPGHIEGEALITMAGWQVVGYQGTLRGENFQTVHHPELQILSTPNLTFEGTSQKVTLRGEVSLPELRIVGAPSRTAIAPSSDVILEGRAAPRAKRSPLLFDAQVRVLLGKRVFVKVAGIDAQLGGAIDLSFSSLDRIASRGEIKVVKGRYRTYGVDLVIVRGRLFFAGGPINSPSLDFLALRTIGDVRAGVTVAGNLQKPLTKLYSVPSMPDVDVLAYIVLGHPLGSSGEQTGLLTQAAGALLTSGQAAVLQEQLKNRLGLSTLEIQGGVGGTPTRMGYKPLQVTPPGSTPETQSPGVTETVLTVGKYLNPKLYISYGRSLFTGTNQFMLRYDIFKHWQIESQTGTESGVDLFYKLEFK